MRQNYTLEQVKEIMNNYDLGEPRDYSLFEVGIENTNMLVETDNGKSVIKVCELEVAEIENIEFEISLMSKAYSCNLPVPGIVKSKTGTDFIIFCGKPVFIMSYLHGNNVQKLQVSFSFLEEVAEASANMLKCFSRIKPAGSEHREHYWDLKTFFEGKKYLTYLESDDESDQEYIKDIYKKWEDEVVTVFPKMRMGYIHNDIAAHNLLINNGHLSGIVDFGDAVYSYIVFELVVAIVQLCMLQDDWQGAISVYAKKFQQLWPLNEVEKDLIYTLALCRSANMVVICNGLCHTETKREDYIWFHDWGIKNLKRLKRLGKEDFDKLL